MKSLTRDAAFCVREQTHSNVSTEGTAAHVHVEELSVTQAALQTGQARDQIMAPNKHLQKCCISQRPEKPQTALGTPRGHIDDGEIDGPSSPT